MFGVFRRLRELEAAVRTLREEVGAGEYERLRGSVLNALRALRRAQQAEEAREPTDPSQKLDQVSARILANRQGGKRGP
jgi:phage tail tape-measure protein